MNSFYELPLFGIFITLLAYFGALKVYEKYRRILLNPILISSILIIAFLVLLQIDYEQYNVGGQYLSFFLGPSVVALGVLFYEKYPLLKKNFTPFLVSVMAGGLMSIFSVIILCSLFATPEVIVRSLVLKSITSPIAIEVSLVVDGLPALTAGVVILVGIFGNAVGVEILRFLKIESPVAVGTALGTTAHGIGTAKALEVNSLAGAYSGVAMCVNGVLTALVVPYILNWLG